MSKFLKSLLATGTAAVMGVSSVSVAQTQTLKRPPQFVMLAFDGSFDLKFWKESRAFAQKARETNRPLCWTYFISGVYYINETNYAMYVPPHKEVEYPSRSAMEKDVAKRLEFASDMNNSKADRQRARRGWSDIGFGNDANDVAERVNQTNLAFEDGHEIASHSNGHFAGGSSVAESKKWNFNQWNSEFAQFTEFIFHPYANNGIPNKTRYADGIAFKQSDVVGFRAPRLDTNKDMFAALEAHDYTYDTSGVNSSAEVPAWPKKHNKTWVFPLGSITMAGTSKKVPSMDYNFFVQQSREKEDLANKDRYRDQMYDSYMKYFNDNYYGNRSPVHIGHHFSKWNGGAYWEAMQNFALEVCGKPEVKCVTYQEYVRYLNDQSDSTLKAYAKGAFPQLPRPANLKALAVVGQSEPKVSLENGILKASAEMDRLSKVLSYKLGLKIDNKLHAGTSVAVSELSKHVGVGSNAIISAVVLNAQGDEVNSFSVKVNEVGTSHEKIDMTRIEDKAALGDLPEAHAHDHE